MTRPAAVIAEWHGKGRNHVAITPRFAITSTPAQMEGRPALAREFPICTSRRISRKTTTRSTSPASSIRSAIDYTTSTRRYGLLGRKALFGHCIHLSEREADADERSRLGRRALPDLQPLPGLRPVPLKAPVAP